jgi:hypothetical protein
MSDGKVFCIGLSRTATRSVYVELRDLGLRAVHYPFDATTERELFAGSELSILSRNDALLDLPAAGFYARLDELYPGSRFVHTTRPRDEWLEAVERHYRALTDSWADWPRRFREFGERITRHVYGAFPFDRDAFAAAYDRHEARIADHFSDRPGDLLRIEITAGSRPEVLAGFLGLPAGPAPDYAYITDEHELPAHVAERTRLREPIAR